MSDPDNFMRRLRKEEEEYITFVKKAQESGEPGYLGANPISETLKEPNKDFKGGSGKAPYYILMNDPEYQIDTEANVVSLRQIDLIDIALSNPNKYQLYLRISIMSRIWRAFEKEGIEGLDDLRKAQYEIERWIKYEESL